MPLAELMIAPLIIGIGHSVETDHLVAVGNLVDVKGNWFKEAIRGASWGLGHTVSVVIAAILFSFIKMLLGDPAQWPFEILVGIMLLVLGAVKLYRLFSGYQESANKRIAFFHVGLIHGLAGSGTVAVLLTTQVKNQIEEFLFLGLFGLGTIMGMAIISGLLTKLKFLNQGYLNIMSGIVAFMSLIYGLNILFNQFS